MRKWSDINSLEEVALKEGKDSGFESSFKMKSWRGGEDGWEESSKGLELEENRDNI